MGSEILKPSRLKSGQKCPDFEWSGFQMVGTIAMALAMTISMALTIAQPFEI